MSQLILLLLLYYHYIITILLKLKFDIAFEIMMCDEGVGAHGLLKATLSWAHLHVVRGGNESISAKSL